MPPLTDVIFHSLMEKLGPFETYPIIAIGVSGGSDSLALAFLAHHWATSKGGKAIALTVDHLLRPDSTTEADTVHDWLQKAGIEHHVLRWENEEKPASNIQAQARNARYLLLKNWCTKHHVLHLLTAHHQNDQAETFMLQLLRGSGVDGLSAMPAITYLQGVRLLRPLLSLTKAQLQHYLQQQSHAWIEDPSNHNPNYLRSHVRNFLQAPFKEEIIPPTLLSERLAKSAGHMGRARDSLEHATASAMVQTVEFFREGYCYLQQEAFCHLEEEIALRILAQLLTQISGRQYKPRFEELSRLYHQITHQFPFKGATLWGCNLFSFRQGLVISREFANIIEKRIPLPAGKMLLWDNRFMVGSKQEGIYIEALGQEDWQQIKPLCSVPLLPKKIIITLPAFKSLETVIAVPHINFYSTTDEKEWIVVNTPLA